MRVLLSGLFVGILGTAENAATPLDRIELVNGRAMVGTIVESGDGYVVTLAGGGTLSLPRDKIARIVRGAEPAPPPRAQPVPPPTVSVSPTTPAASPRWRSFGPYEVRVASASIDVVPLHTGTVASQSTDCLLSVILVIRNPSTSTLLRYESFGGRWLDQAAQRRARLTDDAGNTYPAAHFRPGTIPDGAVDRVAEIYPNTMITDVLVFSRPVDAAKVLTLTLPKETVDAAEDLVLTCEASKIERAP